MPPKGAKPKGLVEAEPSTPVGPVAEAYAAYKNGTLDTDAAIAALQELVLADPPPESGAAACVALVKACTLQAVQVLQMRKPPDEDTAAALLTQAAEAAVRGVLLHKSAQLLCAAAGLLTAASGSGGRELVDRRCSARDLLLGGRGATVSDWQGSGSVLLPPATIKREIAVGSASGDWGGPSERRWFEKLPLTEWAHADTERVPGSERFPWEWDAADSGPDWPAYVLRLQRHSVEVLDSSLSGDTAALVTQTLSRTPPAPKEGEAEGSQATRLAARVARQTANTVKLWKEQHKPESLPLRFVQSGVVLPHDVATRLRRHLKLPAVDAMAAHGLRPTMAQQLLELQLAKAGDIGSRQAKLAERRQKEEEARALEDAARRATLIREHLTGVLAGAPVVEVPRRLAAATRTDLDTLAAMLRELGEAKQLSVEQVEDLEQQLALVRRLCPVEPQDDAECTSRLVCCYRVPPAPGSAASKHVYMDNADEFEARIVIRALREELPATRKKLLDTLPPLRSALDHAERTRERFNGYGREALAALPALALGAEGGVPAAIAKPGEQGPDSLAALPFLSQLHMPGDLDPTLLDTPMHLQAEFDKLMEEGAGGGTATPPPLTSPTPAALTGNGRDDIDSAKQGSGTEDEEEDDDEEEGEDEDDLEGYASAEEAWDQPPSAAARKPPDSFGAQDPLVRLLTAQHEARALLSLSAPVKEYEVPPAFQKTKLLLAAYRRVDALLRPGVLGEVSAALMPEIIWHPSDPPEAQGVSAHEQEDCLGILTSGWRSKLPLGELARAMQNVEPEQAEQAVKAAVQDVARRMDPDICDEAPPVDTKAVARSLELFADFQRRLHSQHPAQLAAAAAAGADPETQLQSFTEYHCRVMQAILSGLDLLASRQRLTRLQADAVLRFLQQHSSPEALEERIQRDQAEADKMFRESAERAEASIPRDKLEAAKASGDEELSDLLTSSQDGILYLQAAQLQQSARKRAKFAKQEDKGWIAAVLYLPLRALERLHAFVCLQVGAAFSDAWEMSNEMQADNFYAGGNQMALAMLVAPPPSGPAAGQKRKQKGQQQQGQQGSSGGATPLVQWSPLRIQHELCESEVPEEPDAARLAHWFALWAVHAQHDVAALDTTALSVAVGGGGGRQGKGSKRGGSGGGGGASSVAPLQAIELALLEDEEARKVASAGEPAITAMRGMAVLAQLAEEVCCVLHGVQAPLPPVVEEWQKAAAATKEQVAACDPPALAAAGRHALALLRCVCDAAQLVTAAKKCLSAAFHPGNTDAEVKNRLAQAVERCCTTTGVDGVMEWAEQAGEPAARQLAFELAELQECLSGTANTSDAQLDDLMLSACRRELGTALLRVQTATATLREGLRQLWAVQEALYMSMRHQLRKLFKEYSMAVPLDNLARVLAGHVLPHLWGKQAASAAEEARRSNYLSLMEQLEEEEAAQAAAAVKAAKRKSKKKKGKKDGDSRTLEEQVAAAVLQAEEEEEGEAEEEAAAAAAKAAATAAAAAAAKQEEGLRRLMKEMEVEQQQRPQQQQQQQEKRIKQAQQQEAAKPEAAPADDHSMEALRAASAAFDWSKVQGADETSWQSSNTTAADEWQDAASSSHKPRSKQQQQSPTVAAASPGKQRRAAASSAPQPRIVGWDGTWVCSCGERHAVDQQCKSCTSPAPCRSWLRGSCMLRQEECRHPHVPFAMQPSDGPPCSMGKVLVLVQNPRAFPGYREPDRPKHDPSQVRVVTWHGDWVCPCGEGHRMRQDCSACGHAAPCRDHLRGTCKLSECRFPHPPFDLHPVEEPAGEHVVRARPGMPAWRPAGPATLPAAGQRPQQAPGMASAAEALAAQLGLGGVHELSQLLPPEELQASLLLMQEQLGQQAQQGSEPASGRASAGGGSAASGHPPAIFLPGGPRMLDRTGAWVCSCGRRNRGGAKDGGLGPGGKGLWKQCTHCSLKVCKKWFTGPCSNDCPYQHPPFDPSGDWAPAAGAKAVLWQGAPRWRRPAAAQPPPPPPRTLQPPPAAAVQQAALAVVAAQQPEAAAALAAAEVTRGWDPFSSAAPVAEVSRGWDPFSSPAFPAVAMAAAAAPLVEPRRDSRLPLATAAGLGRPQSGAHGSPALWQGDGEGIDDLLQHLGIGSDWDAVQPATAAPAAAPAPLGFSSAVQPAVAAPASLGFGSRGGWGESSAAAAPPPARPPAVAAPAPVAFGLAAFAGMQNGSGEYNSFLEAIIHCLWSCSLFRQLVVASWGPQMYGRDRVVSALRSLFTAFAAEEQLRQLEGPLIGSIPRRGLVDPSELRQALSALPGQQQYRVGETSDAGDVLLTIYNRAMSVSPDAGGIVDAIFGLPVSEHVRCHSCYRVTQQSTYTRYFHNTQAVALRQMLSVSPELSMGNLLKLVEQQQLKACDEDAGGCGVRNFLVHSLDRLPFVFTLQLQWNSHQEPADSIAATLAAVDEQVDLADFYAGVPRRARRFHLRSMVCYSGAHYSAFVWAADLGAWLMFDDATISRVGTWADVRRQCEAGRIQPSVLFFEAVD